MPALTTMPPAGGMLERGLREPACGDWCVDMHR